VGLFDWLFGRKKRRTRNIQVPSPQYQSKPHSFAPSPRPQTNISQHQAKFNFLVYEEGEEVEPNKWYQKANWQNKNFINYKGEWDSDWKWSDEGKVKVVGLSRGTRALDFVNLVPLDDFKMYLELETTNPVNKNARKVMACATVNGNLVSKPIGYLPDDIATKYAGVELDIRPSSAFLPTSFDLNLGLEVALLVRSARYTKRKNKT
jgi:hypothetical protein